MRAVQVVNVRWYNATAWYGVNLAARLRDHGHETLVVGLAGTAPLQKAESLGLTTLTLPLNSVGPFGVLDSWSGIKALLEDFKPDVVNCHRGEAFIMWAMLKKRFGFRLFRTRGDQRPPKNSIVNRWLHSRAADGVITTNSAMAGFFRDRLGIPENRLHTVLGGVDTGTFRPDPQARQRIRAHLGIGDQELVIGLVGRLDVVKGIPETIRAVGKAVQERGLERVRLLVVGYESQYTAADVRTWSREAGLDGRVILTGLVNDAADYINAMDLGVVSSLGSEAIARAALEIMACRVPLISSRVGVMPDLLPAEYLFEPGDVAGMAALLARFAASGERRALAQLCFDRIHGSPGESAGEAVGLTMEDFYRQTLDIYQA